MSISNINKSFLITGSLLSRVGLLVGLGGGAILIAHFLPHSILEGVGSNLFNLYTGPGLIVVGIAIEGVSGALVIIGLLRKEKKNVVEKGVYDDEVPAEKEGNNVVLSIDTFDGKRPVVQASLCEGTVQVEQDVEGAAAPSSDKKKRKESKESEDEINRIMKEEKAKRRSRSSSASEGETTSSSGKKKRKESEESEDEIRRITEGLKAKQEAKLAKEWFVDSDNEDIESQKDEEV